MFSHFFEDSLKTFPQSNEFVNEALNLYNTFLSKGAICVYAGGLS